MTYSSIRYGYINRIARMQYQDSCLSFSSLQIVESGFFRDKAEGKSAVFFGFDRVNGCDACGVDKVKADPVISGKGNLP